MGAQRDRAASKTSSSNRPGGFPKAFAHREVVVPNNSMGLSHDVQMGISKGLENMAVSGKDKQSVNSGFGSDARVSLGNTDSLLLSDTGSSHDLSGQKLKGGSLLANLQGANALVELQREGMELDPLNLKRIKQETYGSLPISQKEKGGSSQAKRSRVGTLATMDTDNLVGAQGEPHQEQ